MATPNDGVVAGSSQMWKPSAVKQEKGVSEVVGQPAHSVTKTWNELPKIIKKCLEMWVLRKQLKEVKNQINEKVSKVWQIMQRMQLENYIREKNKSSVPIPEEQGVVELRDKILEVCFNEMKFKEMNADLKLKSTKREVEIVDLEGEGLEEGDDNISISETVLVKFEADETMEEMDPDYLNVQQSQNENPAIPIVVAVRGADGLPQTLENIFNGNVNESESGDTNPGDGGDIEIAVDFNGLPIVKQEAGSQSRTDSDAADFFDDGNVENSEEDHENEDTGDEADIGIDVDLNGMPLLDGIVKPEVNWNDVEPVSNPDADVYPLERRKKLPGLYPTFRGYQEGTGEMIICVCGFSLPKTTKYKKGVCSHHKQLLQHAAETEHKQLPSPPKKRAKKSKSNRGRVEDYPNLTEHANSAGPGPRLVEDMAGNAAKNGPQALEPSDVDGTPIAVPSSNKTQRTVRETITGMRLRSKSVNCNGFFIS